MERVTPAQPGEPRVVTIRCYPFCTGFYRECGKVRVADYIAFSPRRPAQSGKNIPMARSWSNNDASFVVAQFLCEIEGKINGRRFGINLRVRYDPNHSRQRQLRKPANFLRVKSIL